MTTALEKRGRKIRRGNIQIHKDIGPHEVRLHILTATYSYPVYFHLLTDALYKADLHRVSYQNLLDALLSQREPLPEHPALKYLCVWTMSLGLQDTDWALPLAARVVWKALTAPPEYRGSPVVWAALTVAKTMKNRQATDYFIARARALRDGEDMRFAPTGAGFRSPVTGDVAPTEVAEWLAWRLIECETARHFGRRPLGWTALAQRLEGTDHKTMKKHVLALAEYAGVPITLLD